MNFLEDIFSSLFTAVFEIMLLGTFRLIGAAVKWCWHRGQKPWQEIFAQAWNGRLGLLIMAVVVALGIGSNLL